MQGDDRRAWWPNQRIAEIFNDRGPAAILRTLKYQSIEIEKVLLSLGGQDFL